MVGRDDLQVIAAQSFPEFLLIFDAAQRRRHHIFRAFKIRLFVIAVIQQQILRARFGIRSQAQIARILHVFQRVVAAQMNNVHGRIRHFGERNRTMHAFSFSARGTCECVIFRRGVTCG